MSGLNSKIDKWVEVAKKYGAVFDNVKFLEDKDGISVYAIDKNREFEITVPKPIIIPRDTIDIEAENGEYVTKKDTPQDDLREMLNSYISFILSEERVKSLQKIFIEFEEFPYILKDKLKLFDFDDEFFETKSLLDIKRRLLYARTLRKNSIPTFMPFIDFLNHNFIEGVVYGGAEDRVTVRGKPSKSGEVFARYNRGDSFQFLMKYTFPDTSPFAYSRYLNLKLPDGKDLIINRNIFNSINYQNAHMGGVFLPKLAFINNSIILPFVWIGSSLTPRKPFWSFKILWEEEVGRFDTVKIFSLIKSTNIETLAEILEDLDKLENNSAVKMTKSAVINQLKVIGKSFEDI